MIQDLVSEVNGHRLGKLNRNRLILRNRCARIRKDNVVKSKLDSGILQNAAHGCLIRPDGAPRIADFDLDRAKGTEKGIAHRPEDNEREHEEDRVRVDSELAPGWKRGK